MDDLSKEQLEANRENAKLGGVKTDKGKEISKYNACKHSILRQTITEYEEGLYENFLHRLVEELKPTDVTEEVLVERIAICYLKLFRIGKAEKELLLERLRPAKTKTVVIQKARAPLILDDGLFTDKTETTILEPAYISKIKAEDIEKILDIYSRYEITIENRLYKALHELERIRRMKKGEQITAPIPVDVEVSKLGSFGENNNVSR